MSAAPVGGGEQRVDDWFADAPKCSCGHSMQVHTADRCRAKSCACAAERESDAEHPRNGWVYAIRTAPFGNVLYEADSPEACIAAAEAMRPGGFYLPEYDEIVGRPKPVEPEPWSVVVPATGEAAS